MPYVSIPKDLSTVKTKVALNLTKRQLICFGTAALIGIPAYIFTRAALGNTGAVLLMMSLMLTPFFLAMYEKDGMPAEIVLRNYIRARFYWPGIRPYKSENFYAILDEEAKSAYAPENTTAAKTSVRKRKTGKRDPRGSKKGGTKLK